MAPENRCEARDDDTSGHSFGSDAFDRAVVDGVAKISNMAHFAIVDPLGISKVQVQEHDDAGFGVEAGQSDDADPNGDAEVVIQESEDADRSDEREGNGEHDDRGFD